MTDDAYRCGYCDERKVVPSLARDCEARHEREVGEQHSPLKAAG